DEQYTHITMWCVLAQPMLIGCDITKMDEFTLGLFSNDEVLAVHQDALGKQATCVTPFPILNQRVYLKKLEDGGAAAAFFNLAAQPAEVAANWADLELKGKQTARDLWRQKDLG